MMEQAGAVFVEGEKYVRVKESGWIYPPHAESEKQVRKETAEYVILKDGEWSVIKNDVEEAPKKVISTPAKRPEPPKKAAAQPQPLPVVKTAHVETPAINLMDGFTEPQ